MPIIKNGLKLRPMKNAKRVNLFNPKAGFSIGAWSSVDGNVTEKPATIVSMSNSRIELATEAAWRGYASGLIEVKPSTTYRVTYDRSKTPAVYFAVDERGADGEFLRIIGYSTSATHKSYSFTTSANARYIKLVFEHGGQAGVVGNMIVNNIELHETSATVPFEKYKNYLPSSYREVEYIESTGSQKIDTAYSVGLGERWYSQIDVQYVEATTASQVLMGTGTSNGSWLGQNDSMYSIGGSDGKFYDSTTRRIIRSIWGNAPEATIDEIRRFYLNTIDTKDGRISLFASLNASNPYYSKARVYSCQIMDSNRKFVRNFVPCIRVADEKAGLYDTVEGKFYTDANNGNFVSGPVVSDSVARVLKGKDVVYDDKFIGFELLESITSTSASDAIRVPFYMDHKYVTDIQFSNDAGEMTPQKRILRPINLGGNSGGTYWEGTFANYTTGQYALGGSVYVPTTAGVPSDRNKVLWYYDKASTTMNISVNGTSASRSRSSTNPAQGYNVRGIVDNVAEYTGKQIIYRETEYNEDMTKVLHDFVPVRRIADGRLGFYDIMTGKFHCSGSNNGLTATELPASGYAELEYVKHNGNSWFNTGVQSSIYGYKFEIDATITKATVDAMGVNGSTPNWIKIIGGNVQSFGNVNLVSVGVGDRVKYGLEFFEDSDSKAFAENLATGESKTITSSIKGYGGAYLHFLKTTTNATANADIKIHGFKIWRQGVLVRDYAPVLRKFDFKVGYFDRVEGKFYTNEGTDDFTAGPVSHASSF